MRPEGQRKAMPSDGAGRSRCTWSRSARTCPQPAGAPRATLEAALAALAARGLEVAARSGWYRTPRRIPPGPGPDYVNGAAALGGRLRARGGARGCCTRSSGSSAGGAAGAGGRGSATSTCSPAATRCCPIPRHGPRLDRARPASGAMEAPPAADPAASAAAGARLRAAPARRDRAGLAPPAPRAAACAEHAGGAARRGTAPGSTLCAGYAAVRRGLALALRRGGARYSAFHARVAGGLADGPRNR